MDSPPHQTFLYVMSVPVGEPNISCLDLRRKSTGDARCRMMVPLQSITGGSSRFIGNWFVAPNRAYFLLKQRGPLVATLLLLEALQKHLEIGRAHV